MTTRSSSVACTHNNVRKLKIQRSWTAKASDFSHRVLNPARELVDSIKMPDNSDRKLIPLSLGDPTVFGNLKCPQGLVDTIVRSTRSMKHNGDVKSVGSDAAREAVAEAYGCAAAPLTKNDVVITRSGTDAIEMAFRGLLNSGDSILLPRPGFPMYQVVCDAHQIHYKFYDLLPEKNWEVDVAQLATLVDHNTRAIVVNNPSNPCGSVYSKQHLMQILDVADEYKLSVIADEVYGAIVFGEAEFFPIATLTQTVPVIALSGLAKKFAIPGWCVGWISVHDRNDILKEVREAYFKLSQISPGANSLVLSTIPELLMPARESPEEKAITAITTNYYGTLERNAKTTTDALSNIPGLNVLVPHGSMYAMVELDVCALADIDDDVDFMQQLLTEESVYVLPGTFFGLKNFFRVAFAAPQDVLEEAYARIGGFCRRRCKSFSAAAA